MPVAVIVLVPVLVVRFRARAGGWGNALGDRALLGLLLGLSGAGHVRVVIPALLR
jgi:hypothetical protein